MKKHTWPNGDIIVVNCPNCDLTVEVQICEVKEYDLPLRPAECENCGCDFDVFHNGRLELLRVPPKQSDPITRKVFLEKFEDFVFDPNAIL
jgi:transcription elongation factor Elf1